MIDTLALVQRLRTIESIAVMPRVSSTNALARRIAAECIDNGKALPKAILVAGEQYAGRGRNERTWTSPAGRGIYSTTLLTRDTRELAVLPLQMANAVATYLRDVFAIDAKVKWPNDIYVDGKKIAGILIEARILEQRAYVAVGIGINVEPVDDVVTAVSIRELTQRAVDLDVATIAFIEHLDDQLSRPADRETVIEEWRRLAMHQPGERITCVLGERTVTGTWGGIDDSGRALLRRGENVEAISAGDIIVEEHVQPEE